MTGKRRADTLTNDGSRMIGDDGELLTRSGYTLQVERGSIGEKRTMRDLTVRACRTSARTSGRGK